MNNDEPTYREEIKRKQLEILAKERKDDIRDMKKRGKDVRMKVYGYTRVSTGEQNMSIENQEQKIINYCQQNNLRLIHVLKEHLSGSVPYNERPQFQLILKNLEVKNIEGIVVAKLDRLGRSTLDSISLMAKFNERQWYMIILDPMIDIRTPTGKFFFSMMSSFAELERNMITQRIKDVIRFKKDNDIRVGTIPFGKKVLVKDNIQFLIDDEDEQNTLKIINDLRTTKVKTKKGLMKPMTYQAIAEELIKLGRKNKIGIANWYSSQVRKYFNGGHFTSKRKAEEEKEYKLAILSKNEKEKKLIEKKKEKKEKEIDIQAYRELCAKKEEEVKRKREKKELEKYEDEKYEDEKYERTRNEDEVTETETEIEETENEEE